MSRLERRAAVVVASVNRSALLGRLLQVLVDQSHLPTEVVLSVPTSDSLPDLASNYPFVVTLVVGTRGSAAQRNVAIAGLTSSPDYVFFFDDDAIPRQDYIENACAVFEKSPDVVGITGLVVVDGASLGTEVSIAAATDQLDASYTKPAPTTETPVEGLYGCNFAVRAQLVERHRFDDALPLYSWLEDLDFSRRLSREGKLVRSNSCVAAHLGAASGGRLEHRRFGYSQVTNPVYLLNKGSITRGQALRLIVRPLARNLAGFAVGKASHWRRARFAGNLLSFSDLVRRRVTPGRILKM